MNHGIFPAGVILGPEMLDARFLTLLKRFFFATGETAMANSINKLDDTSHLILHRTNRKDAEAGISVIVRGEGVRVIDQDGNSYIDLEAGGTRPVHVGYGRSDLARAGYEQMCEMALPRWGSPMCPP